MASTGIRLPARCRQGDTFGPFPVTLYAPPVGGALPLPLNVTGWTCRSQVRGGPAEYYPGTPPLVLCDGAPPWFLTASAVDTLTLPPGDYVYDVQITKPGGLVQTYFSGPFPVDPDVSR